MEKGFSFSFFFFLKNTYNHSSHMFRCNWSIPALQLCWTSYLFNRGLAFNLNWLCRKAEGSLRVLIPACSQVIGPFCSCIFVFSCFLIFYVSMYKDLSFETRPDLAGQSGTRIERKKRKGKTQCDPADPTRSGCKIVDFFFLLKWCCFDLKKNWPGRPGQTRWPGQNQEPEPWTGPGLKL